MHIAIITAGGAGMFCGSCMLDNAWAKALMAAGAQVSLLPMYTPLRLDSRDATTERIFFGGISTYLSMKAPGWNRLPRWATRWVDSRWVISLATRGAVSNNARELGEMTQSMLAAEEGPLRPAIDEMVSYLVALRPDVVVYSNSMLLSSLRELKRVYPVPAYCVLQGDDVFLDGLVEPYRTAVMRRLMDRCGDFDGFIVHSNFYRDVMSSYLQIPFNKFHQLPLTIDLDGHVGRPRDRIQSPPRVGYFARLAPEKGLLPLVQAVVELSRRRPDVELHVGGYRGPNQVEYVAQVKAAAEPLGSRFRDVGGVDSLAEKSRFLSSVDLLSVPAVFGEPKGLYVLESLANGTPVVQPASGSFPELVESTGGGLLVEPGSPTALAEGLDHLLADDDLRRRCANNGWATVRSDRHAGALARASLALFESQIDK